MALMTFTQMMSRSLLPLACALMATTGALAQTGPAAEAAVAGATTSTTSLTAPDGRVIDVTVIAPAAPRGVILFSHGGNSNPLNTPALHARLTARGFAVIAPTHTDSLSLPAERRTGLMAAFMTRVTDMKVAAGYAAQAFPGLPMAQVGYSYGSLTSLIGGGAFTSMVPGSNPGVKAVVMFSSPGPIAMLTGAPGAFDGVKGPTLLVTGDADKVPGFADDPAAHLIYFDKLPAGDHTALIVGGATHEFVGAKQPGWDEVAVIVDDFLVSRVFDDAAVGARFDAATSSALVTVKRK
ncbi:alpha/beta hydrolase [Porphyrobacter sp. TH134]|uniref:alpha/beta hydrolase n=1 Tax=Porphyrobacter sp. TH134 TaxID=2067450 RepID=UPI0011800DD7|nr:alpha/beta hydrolase [Porphyrobacter sp. TH134]